MSLAHVILTSFALLLAVPCGLFVMLLALRAIGPGRPRYPRIGLPDLPDDRWFEADATA